MWADAQRDGALPNIVGALWECSVIPLFPCTTPQNHANFDWPPLSDVAAITKPRRETRWNLPGCPKLANRSQLFVGRSSPYCEVIWNRYCCLTSFSRLSIHALIANTQPDIVVQCNGARIAIFGVIFASCISARRVQRISDTHSKFALRATSRVKLCESMVDIQSPTTDIIRGKTMKEEEETTGRKYNGLPYCIGRP